MKIPSQSYCKLLLPAPFYIPYVPAPQNSLPFPNEVYERLRMLWLYSAYYWVPFIFSLYPVRFKSVFSYTHQDTTQIHLNTTENLFSRCYALPDWSFPSMSTTIPSSLYYDIVLLLVLFISLYAISKTTSMSSSKAWAESHFYFRPSA